MHGTKFYRPARNYSLTGNNLPRKDILVPAPPKKQASPGGVAQVLQLLVPLVASMGSVVFIIAFHSNPLILVASAGVAICSVSLGLGTYVHQRHTNKKRQNEMQRFYLGQLNKISEQLAKTAAKQQAVNDHLYPPVEKLERIITQQGHEQPQLWERRPEDQDFLHVRIGTGEVPLCSAIHLEFDPNNQMDPSTQYVEDLKARALELVATYNHIDQAPITLGLKDIGVLTINGNSQQTQALLRAMLCQVATFHSPEDVRIVVYSPSLAATEWNWLKWLPHSHRLYQLKPEKQQAPEQLCLLADNIADFQELMSKQIKRELDRRRQLGEDKKDESVTELMKPHLILVLEGYAPGNELAGISEIRQFMQDSRINGLDAAKHGVTIICLVNTKRQEPASVKARITVAENRQLTFVKVREGGNGMENILADAAPPQICEQVARSLAPFTLAEKGSQQDLSQDVRLLDVLGFSSIDELQPDKIWQPRKKQNLLRVPIGMCDSGVERSLDLKETAEKGMGPHGLVVGATGSGKSELLRTLIISLAITHDPQQVNFLLVDFKGGASFADFAGLPHVAGNVSNLQSEMLLVNRVYESLQGEQDRRQTMLRGAGNLAKISDYQAKWQANRATMEPMPYLLIIVDEFAELISSRSDFLDLFVGIGRVGRSLGMHLLLSTQRLEQGRLKGLDTYLSYQICLRTFSATESSIVLGAPDAFYLPSAPGVGYLKVDTSIYSLFKTALISAPYIPLAQHSTALALIREFTPTGKLDSNREGRNISGSLSGNTESLAEQPPSEMDMVIQQLALVQRSAKWPEVHQVSLPPLSERLSLGSILTRCQVGDLDGSRWPPLPPAGLLHIPVGLLDKPRDQVQEPLFLDFSGAGGHLVIVGAPRSGKSIFLSTLIASFVLTHSPRDVQIYGIDLGGGLLQAFEGAPHVGTICTNTRIEGDKIRRMVYQMRKIIEERAVFFQEQRIEITAYRTRRRNGTLAQATLGDVFLIIDNLARLNREIESLKDEVIDVVTTGLNYGVHVIIAANSWSEVPPKLRDKIGTRLELHLHEPTESEFGKAAAAAVPATIPGRGLSTGTLQFQTALPWLDIDQRSPDATLQECIEPLLQRAKQAWKGSVAPPIRMLPKMVKYEMLLQIAKKQQAGVPIGVDEFRLEPVYIDLFSSIGPHFLIFGDSECGKTNLLRLWMRGIERLYTPDLVKFAIIDFGQKLGDLASSPHLAEYVSSSQTLKECVEGLRASLVQRQQAIEQAPHDQAARLKQAVAPSPRYFVFVDDYDLLSAQAPNPFTPIYDALLNARATGLHLILARSAGGAGTSFDPILKRLRNDLRSPGLVMNGSPQDGALLETQKAGPFPPGRGYLVQRRFPPTQIQIAFIDPALAGSLGAT